MKRLFVFGFAMLVTPFLLASPTPRFYYQLNNVMPDVIHPVSPVDPGSQIPPVTPDRWVEIEPLYGAWQVTSPPACSGWSPSPFTVALSVKFEQSRGCTLGRTRSVTAREQNEKTLVLRDGDQTTEVEEYRYDETQPAFGQMETWLLADPVYGQWSSSGSLYGCGDWAPEASSLVASGSYEQVAKGCKVDQHRTRQDREVEETTGSYRDVGVVTESRVLEDQALSRNYTVTYSPWVDISGQTTCVDWAPLPSTYSTGVLFSQSSTHCTKKQTRTRTDSYSLPSGGMTVSPSATETQSLVNQSSERSAYGTRFTHTLTVGSYTAWGAPWLGFFGPKYMSDFGASMTTIVKGSLSPDTFNGYTIDHFIQNDGGISMRLLPATVYGQKPNLTINGQSCVLTGPDIYSAYNADCGVSLKNFIGEKLLLDLR